MAWTNYGMTYPAVAGTQYEVPWLHPSSFSAGQFMTGAGGTVTIPSASVTPGGLTTAGGETVGGSFLPGTSINHVSITTTAANQTYIVPHGLTYAPTGGYAVLRLAEGTTPTTFVGFCPADTNATNVAFNLGAVGTYDLYYW